MNFKALCSLIPLPVPPTDIGRKRTANISCARRFPERAPRTAVVGMGSPFRLLLFFIRRIPADTRPAVRV